MRFTRNGKNLNNYWTKDVTPYKQEIVTFATSFKLHTVFTVTTSNCQLQYLGEKPQQFSHPHD
jgi:hypothetical protein